MATPNRRYTEIPGPVTPDVPYWVNQSLRDVDADVEKVDRRARDADAALGIRVAGLETLGGLAPGDTSDATTAALLRNDGTEAAKAVDTRATAAARAEYAERLAALTSWLPRQAPGPLRPLDKWRAAYATGKAQVVAVGDSITEGTGATAAGNRWQNRLNVNLRALNKAQVGADFPFIPAHPVSSVPGKPVTTNAGGRRNTHGISGRTATLSEDSHYVEFTFTGNMFELMYLSASGTGIMSVSIDGAAAVTVDTNNVRLGVLGQMSAVWKSPTLGWGAHRVMVRRHSSTPSGQMVWLQGMLTYDRDKDLGIRVLDGGYHGARSSTFTAADRANQAEAIKAAGGAALVILGFGVNDTDTAPLDFRANIQAFIKDYRDAGVNASFLLLGMYKVNSKTEAEWFKYTNELAWVARATADTAFLDLGRHMPEVPTPYGAVPGLDLYADNLHPSDAGHEWIAQVLTSALAS